MMTTNEPMDDDPLNLREYGRTPAEERALKLLELRRAWQAGMQAGGPGEAKRRMEAIKLFTAPANARKLVHRWRDRASAPDVREID